MPINTQYQGYNLAVEKSTLVRDFADAFIMALSVSLTSDNRISELNYTGF